MYRNNYKKKVSGSNSVIPRESNHTSQYIINKKKRFRIKKVKRIIYLFAIVSCFFIILGISAILKQLTNVFAYYGSSQTDSNISDTTFKQAETSTYKNDSFTESNNWNLILINNANSITEELSFSKETLTNGIQVDQHIYQPLQDMLRNGEQEGLSFVVCSGYRTIKTQTVLLNDKVKQLQAEGFSYKVAYETAGTEVAFPGASEHHLGLAIDIVASAYQMLDDEQANTPEAIWLIENCHKYGFILRYPEDKQDVTNIIFEPWHFRYVGIEAATEIMTNNITLEEYLAKINK